MWYTAKIVVIALTAALAGCAEWQSEPQPDDRLAPTEVMAAAQVEDGRTAFLAYRQASTDEERRKWICIAANRDNSEAQAEIARLHWPSPERVNTTFRRDSYTAYIWAIIAMRNRQPLEHMEERLSWILQEDERWEAQVQAAAWRPDPSQCENIEDSDYFRVTRQKRRFGRPGNGR